MGEKTEKVKKLAELFELIQYYYENRDRPINSEQGFFEKIEECCSTLEIDMDELIKEFKLLF